MTLYLLRRTAQWAGDRARSLGKCDDYKVRFVTSFDRGDRRFVEKGFAVFLYRKGFYVGEL